MMRRRRIDSRLVLIFTPHFPYNRNLKNRFNHEAIIGIGGNVGDTVRRFEKLWWSFARTSHISVETTSPILKNPPFGYERQADFFNAVMRISTTLPPKALMRFLLKTEKRFGRKRSFKNAPRTLDIDIIFYDTRTMKTKLLTLPHPHWYQRESVVIPLETIQR